ncbi:hypothetical protein MMC34_003904 [Xylographa carneopallida]|nr:hypothetical protein [Xylographa carneopallida]
MSLARALTKRYRSHETSSAIPPTPGRAASTRKFDRHFDRNQISLPIELLSTTNVLALTAPDLHDLHDFNSSSSASSATSFDDSSSSRAASSSSSISSPDSPSRECSPVIVEPNHLSTYFEVPSKARSSVGSHRQSNASVDADAPAIPSRAISHTKKTHQALARERSQSMIRSPPTSLPTNAPRSSLDMFSNKPDANHPFGAELAQVNELAEDFGVQDITVWDEEEQFLVEHGLQRFTVDDYVNEIQGLFGGVSDDGRSHPMVADWI